jgi:DNA-binding beta-propeller fold protein YncE
MFLVMGLLFSSSLTASGQPVAGQWPGPQPDGSVLLPNQWSLRPAGRQVALGDFPVNIAVHPGGKHAAVLHSGYGRHEVVMLELPEGTVIERVAIQETFYGLVWSADGRQLHVSGAGDEVVHRFAFQRGRLTSAGAIAVRPAKERGVPAGLALSADGKRLFVCELWGQRVSQLDLASGAVTWSVPLGDETPLSWKDAASQHAPFDLAAATKRQEAMLDPTSPAAPFPYACVVDEARNRLYVSLWAQACVAVIDLGTREIKARWPTQQHPNELRLTSRHLFVANANRNTVSILDPQDGRLIETLTSAMRPDAPPGSTPNSLALSPDESRLFVANADNNNVAVFDVSRPGRSRSLGFIPVGWYPTSVRVTPNGRQLLVANGKGLTSKANPKGPQPRRTAPGSLPEYIGGLLDGSLTVLDLPRRRRLEQSLRRHTAVAYQCLPRSTPDSGSATVPAGVAGNPVPQRLEEPSPIRYCLYVVKENRTYDQVLGDMPGGRGDASLCLFPERITPNHHKLAREFVLLDNFYVDGEVSADGHEWSMGAYATDFVEKAWPLSYGHNKHNKYPYPSEGKFPVAEPAGGYLWDRAREAGVSYRSYGEFVNAGKNPGDPATTRIAALQGHFDPWFPPWNMDVPDMKRAERFIQELARFEREGDMPRLQILRLPNDHTFGTTVGKPTPTAMVAENDLAFGRLVEAVTRSKFWPQTAIFVVEDDAQNGPDHVDAHRTIAYVISPYARRGAVDSTMYSTSSMLRTMELILGLKPMSQYDAQARAMAPAFQALPDLRPYDALPANVDLEERNTATAWGASMSARMDFSKEDAADDLQLNEVIWRSVRGAESPMPAPVRAAFLFPHTEEDEDDE